MAHLTGEREFWSLPLRLSAAVLIPRPDTERLVELALARLPARWPHAVAFLIGIAAMTVLWRFRRPLSALGFMTMLTSAGLGIFHAGVEQQWWEGPTTCVGTDPGSMNSEDLLNALMEAPMVRCDEIVWDLWGITMAGWNALISLGLALLWIFAALPKTPTRHVVPG